MTQKTGIHVLTVSSCKIWQRIVALFLGHDVGHHVNIVGKRRDPESLNDDIRQVVWVQHQVLLAVMHQVLIVSPLILPHGPH